MRSPGSRTLITLTWIGLIAAPATFSNSATAATTHARSTHESGAGLSKRHHLAQSSCRQQRFDTAQVVGAVLSAPPLGPLYVGGCRVWVDPHGHYVPSEYQYNPVTGNYELQ